MTARPRKGRLRPAEVVSNARKALLRGYAPEKQSPLLDALIADMERGDGQRTAYAAAAKALGLDSAAVILQPRAGTTPNEDET